MLKSGNRFDITNCIPSSILPNFAKLLYQEIYCNGKPYLSTSPHGFVSGKSILTNSAVITQQISLALDLCQQADKIYTDLPKAFDRVDNGILFSKRDLMGFC